MSVPEGRCLGILLKPSTKNDDGCFPRTDSDDDPSDEHDDSVLMTYTDDGIVLPSKSHQWMHSMFHPSEIALGMTLKCSRTSFWLGRLAIRTALDYPDYPILRDSFGRPMLSKGLFGSISHKQNKGVAIVSSTKRDEASGTVLAGIGIDLEMTSRPGRPSIAKKVLTEREQQSLGGLPGVDTDEEVLLRFSLKEAIYKAAHPLICQYVGFQEAEVTPAPDGSATCDWFLETKADQRISKLTAHWRRVSGDDDDGDFFLTTASVYAKPEEI
jgi:4'-phosphopantetheinyl transferase EntD